MSKIDLPENTKNKLQKFLSTKDIASLTKGLTSVFSKGNDCKEIKRKKKIGFIPFLSHVAFISTYLPEDQFEIIYADLGRVNEIEKYGQSVFGDWCVPVKCIIAFCNRLVVGEKVDILVGIAANVCRYPVALGDINKWVDKEVDYYTIPYRQVCLSTSGFIDNYSQMRKFIPGLSQAVYLKKLPTAIQRVMIADQISKSYLKNLPLVKDSRAFKNRFRQFRDEFMQKKTVEDSKEVLARLERYIKKTSVRKKPKYRFLVSGDISVVNGSFLSFFDIDLFLARQQSEIFKFGIARSIYHLKHSRIGKKAHKLLSEVFSNRNLQVNVNDSHICELITLYHILEGVESGVDGIIFVKPNMCLPSDNISYLLKEKKYFGLPAVELSYDEHSGSAGMITRLEAFLNIVEERG